MNLHAFDGSDNMAFVSSNLFARNQTEDSYGYIMRWITTQRIPPTSPSTYPAVFPAVRPANPIAHFFNASGFGTVPVYNLTVGWYRMSLLTWGICHFCNPWDEPTQQQFLAGASNRLTNAVDDYPEFYFKSVDSQMVIADEVPLNRTYYLSSQPPVRRIPINAHPPGEIPAKTGTLNQFTRVVSFSFYINAPLLFQPTACFAADSIQNYVMQEPGGVFYDLFANIGQDNIERIDPVAPVLYNNAPTTLFVNREPITGIGAVITSLTQDTQYRGITYT